VLEHLVDVERRCRRIQTPVCSAVTMLSRREYATAGGNLDPVTAVSRKACAMRTRRARRVRVPDCLRHTSRAELNTNSASASGGGRTSIAWRDRLVEMQHRHQLRQQWVVTTAWADSSNQRVFDLVALPGWTQQHHRRAELPDSKQRSDDSGRLDAINAPGHLSHATPAQTRRQPVSQGVQPRQGVLPLLEYERGRFTW